MPKYAKERKKALVNEPSEMELSAYHWGVNNGYIISPLGISGDSDNYRIGIAVRGTPNNVNKDPNIYSHDEVMEKVYSYYLYYYNKRES